MSLKTQLYILSENMRQKPCLLHLQMKIKTSLFSQCLPFLWWWILPAGLWRHYNLIVWMTLIIPRRCFPTIIKFAVVSDLKAIRHLALCLQMYFKPFTVDIVSKFDTIWWIFYWQLLQNQIIFFVFKYYQFVLWGINFSVILIL